jgi:hypothetical protein
MPTNVWINNRKQPVKNWVSHLTQAAGDSWASWKDDKWNVWQRIAIWDHCELVSFRDPDGFTTLDDALTQLTALPFHTCALAAIYFDAWVAADYETWGFSRGHMPHGWGCLFRGAGHDRLVSRRWLDFGPWRVLRLPNDTSFVQFHDLAITDPAEAYAIAKLGHERMGNSPHGGYLQHSLDVLLGHTKGLYFAEQHLLEVVVPPDATVDQFDMLRACADRFQHRVAPPTTDRIDRIAYVFLDQADAQRHLHELWLRELECWCINRNGAKVRLDADYHPVPSPPAWVARLEQP